MATHKSYQLINTLSREFEWGKSHFPSFQHFFYDLFWLPFKLILGHYFTIELETKENLANVEGPIIIASSHASWIDSFIIGICFPFNAKVSPIRYAVWWKYYYFPPFTLLLWLLGNFPVRKGIGLEKALSVPLKILEDGGCVGIFPTGKRARNWNSSEPQKPRRGVSYLAIKTKTPILPIKIEGNLGMKFRDFLKKKYKIKIRVGRLFYLPYRDVQDESQLNSGADLVMKKILEL